MDCWTEPDWRTGLLSTRRPAAACWRQVLHRCCQGSTYLRLDCRCVDSGRTHLAHSNPHWLEISRLPDCMNSRRGLTPCLDKKLSNSWDRRPGRITKPPSQTIFRFLSSNGKYWCILGANFIAVELPVLHA